MTNDKQVPPPSPHGEQVLKVYIVKIESYKH